MQRSEYTVHREAANLSFWPAAPLVLPTAESRNQPQTVPARRLSMDVPFTIPHARQPLTKKMNHPSLPLLYIAGAPIKVLLAATPKAVYNKFQQTINDGGRRDMHGTVSGGACQPDEGGRQPGV